MADDAPQADPASRAEPSATESEASAQLDAPTEVELPTEIPTQVEAATEVEVPTQVEAEVPTQVEVPAQAEVARSYEAFSSVERRAAVVAVRPSPARSALRRKVLIGVAFIAPSLVIAASLFFIVRGGEQSVGLPANAIVAQPAPSSSPSLFPGETEDDGSELAEATSDAGTSLEQPNQVVPEVSAPGAALPPGFEDDTGGEEPAPSKPAPPKHFATVQEAAAGSCSTESVDGLSRQIIDQARCIKPNDFVPLPKRANLMMAPNVYPYLELGARDHLLKALDSKKSLTMTVNSALRTVAQQYLVSHWSVSKICGVQLATRPGESNHEIGTALDIKEAASWRPALEAQDFKWLGASDRVHFDYKTAAGGARTATDVLAFQKLWNRNHKDDAITETGHFDTATEQRLKKSPPSGFALGASCAKARSH